MKSMVEVQQRLKDLGLYNGLVDGIVGKKTDAAIKAFQRSVGIEDDGIPGNQTQAHLFPEPVDQSLDRDTDPVSAEPAHVPPVWPRQSECERYYGAVGTNQTQIIVPYPMYLAWDGSPVVHKITCHEKVADSALRCLTRIADAYDEDERREIGADQFGGCLNVRPMRGGTRYSMHSWGIAMDWDPNRNPLRASHKEARLARPDAKKFLDIWEEEGWVSLGRARDFDWMHVQAARL